MTPYMDNTHPDAFVDWPVRQPTVEYGYTKCCHVCKGHGGWNLKLNSYSLHGRDDTAENRHKFAHFRSVCSHCDGWGYVREDETCIGHQWVLAKNLGRCYNLYKCKHCGKEQEVDSSD